MSEKKQPSDVLRFLYKICKSQSDFDDAFNRTFVLKEEHNKIKEQLDELLSLRSVITHYELMEENEKLKEEKDELIRTQKDLFDDLKKVNSDYNKLKKSLELK